MVQPDVLPFEALANPDDWAKTSKRKDCSMCLTKFTTFKRRHHCRICGDIICGTCFVKRKADIPMVGIIDVKVCTSCANNERPSRVSLRPSSIPEVDMAMDTRSTFSDDRPSSFFMKPTHPSDSTSTYSSSVFSESSVRLGLSPENPSSPVRESEDGCDELPMSSRGPREMKDIHAQWLQESDLQPLRQLSEGSARYDIWIMRHRDGDLLVSKRLNMDHINAVSVEQFIDLVELHSQIQHPHIIDFHGVAYTLGRRIQALYEYLPRGDLRTFLDATARDAKSRQERSRNKLQMALDIAEALVHLHSFSPPIVHGSLDSGEVMLTKDYRAKLGGIGATAADRMAKKSQRWQAPEVVSDAGVYLPASDVYAFGVILCELDTHQIPYADCLTPQGEALPEDEILQMVATGELQPTISRDCPTELRRLASDCLAFDPKDRPTAVEVTVCLRMFIRSYGLESSARDEKKTYDLGFTPSRPRSEGVMF